MFLDLVLQKACFLAVFKTDSLRGFDSKTTFA